MTFRSCSLAVILSLASLNTFAVELPSQTCFSVMPDGRPEMTLLVMEDLQSASQKTLQIKLGGLKANKNIPLDAEGYSFQITESFLKGSIATYRGNGFSLEIDKSRGDSSQSKMILGKLDLETSLQVIDPASQKPAQFKNKTVSCAKM